MNKTTIYIMITLGSLLTFYSCQNKYPHVGTLISVDIDTVNNQILLPTGALSQYYELTVRGIAFDVVRTPEGVVVFSTTTDPNFVVNGYKVGDVLSRGNLKETTSIVGWSEYFSIDQDWHAALSSINEEEVRIDFLFSFKF